MKNINELSEEEQIEIVGLNWVEIVYIKNPSKEVEINAVRNLDYNFNWDIFINNRIKSKEAIELYNRLKNGKKDNKMKSIVDIDKLVELIHKGGSPYNNIIKYMPEDIKMGLIKKSGHYITLMGDESEEIQIAAARNMLYYDGLYDNMVDRYIKNIKAKDIYYKMKKVYGVMR